MATQSEKFSLDFVMGGVAAVISKSAAAPLETVKLLLQNQGEVIKRGQLKRPYMGVGECFRKKACCLSGEVTRQMSFDIFPPSFLLGWSITTVSGICAYPFDTL